MRAEDFVKRAQVEKNQDQTFSYSGTKDFVPTSHGDIVEIGPKLVSTTRPRTVASKNNSIT